MRTIITYLLFLTFWSFNLQAQETETRKLVKFEVVNGDTILFIDLPIYQINDKRTWRSKMAESRYRNLKRKVINVYPYAKAAGEKLRYHNTVLANLKTDKARNKYMKKVEKDINATFGSELKDLTISEGVILIKLIDRETGDTSYSLLQEYRSGMTAFVWQGVARLFGHNLKDEYNSLEDEKAIEEIVNLIEEGVYEVASIK